MASEQIVFLPFNSSITVVAITNSADDQNIVVEDIEQNLTWGNWTGNGEDNEIGRTTRDTSNHGGDVRGYRVRVSIRSSPPPHDDQGPNWRDPATRTIVGGGDDWTLFTVLVEDRPDRPEGEWDWNDAKVHFNRLG